MRLHVKAGAACVMAFFLFAGCRQPVIADPLTAQGGAARFLLLIVHGSGDTAGGWPAELNNAVSSALDEPGSWDIVCYDWSRYADNKLAASRAGLAIGAAIGASLASDNYTYEAIQMVGHSAGAFVMQGACDAYRERGGAARVQLTFLDPFTGNGFIDWTYGRRRFGAGADFAEAYTNTDDPVPSTNGLLLQVHNFDVTALAPDTVTDSNGHWWPVTWYTQSVGSGTGCGYGLSLMSAWPDPTGFDDFAKGGKTVLQ